MAGRNRNSIEVYRLFPWPTALLAPYPYASESPGLTTLPDVLH
jgi:hypothetical protein